MREHVKLFFDLFKLRIGFAIGLTALAGALAVPGQRAAAWQVAILVACVIAASASAGAFNQYVERDLDARMGRTRGRAFVTGRLQARAVLARGDRPHAGARGRGLRGRGEPRGRPLRLPGRVLLRGGLHGPPQAPHLDEHRDRRARRQLRGARRRDERLPGEHRPRRPVARVGALPVDAAALLEPRDRLPRRLPRGRRADAPGRGGRRPGGARGARRHRRPRRLLASCPWPSAWARSTPPRPSPAARSSCAGPPASPQSRRAPPRCGASTPPSPSSRSCSSA